MNDQIMFKKKKKAPSRLASARCSVRVLVRGDSDVESERNFNGEASMCVVYNERLSCSSF